jgi:hypothetical protein
VPPGDVSVYDGLRTWLENAELEFDRRSFAAIIATQNPRSHRGVVLFGTSHIGTRSMDLPRGASPERTPEALTAALSAMLLNCKELHLVDPHFGPGNARHRKVLEAMMNLLANQGLSPEVIRVHSSAKLELGFFEKEAAKMAARLPTGCTVEFVRWRQKKGGEKLHNRYVLTDLGGILLGVGLDSGEAGESDDLVLLPRAQYERRWSQYVCDRGDFECEDRPAPVHGERELRPSKGARG